MSDRDRREERAHGGLVARDGDMVTLGDGAQWWLNGTPWARDEADGLIARDGWVASPGVEPVVYPDLLAAAAPMTVARGGMQWGARR